MANCTSCGKALTTTESVCDSCDSALEKYEAHLEIITKPYLGKKSKKCPHCNELFAPMGLRIVLYPENTAWYKPKKPVLSCPLCFKYIKSKYNRLMGTLYIFNIVLGITLLKYFDLYGLIFLTPIFILFCILGIRQKNDVNEFEIRNI